LEQVGLKNFRHGFPLAIPADGGFNASQRNEEDDCFSARAPGVALSRTPMRAWSGAGHVVIAAKAYRQLSPKLKTRVTEILKSQTTE